MPKIPRNISGRDLAKLLSKYGYKKYGKSFEEFEKEELNNLIGIAPPLIPLICPVS
ncbi:MAG: hypothetical protein M1276_05470 [Deltaproteobacteria bacterium]|nr:hypothetical protein [Deltaproteobacteria bacterium]